MTLAATAPKSEQDQSGPGQDERRRLWRRSRQPSSDGKAQWGPWQEIPIGRGRRRPVRAKPLQRRRVARLTALAGDGGRRCETERVGIVDQNAVDGDRARVSRACAQGGPSRECGYHQLSRFDWPEVHRSLLGASSCTNHSKAFPRWAWGRHSTVVIETTGPEKGAETRFAVSCPLEV